MYVRQVQGYLTLEWAIDETIPGRHPNCACCQIKLLKGDERIVLRKTQPNKQGIREGIFLCGNCAHGVFTSIGWLLEENKNAKE